MPAACLSVEKSNHGPWRQNRWQSQSQYYDRAVIGAMFPYIYIYNINILYIYIYIIRWYGRDNYATRAVGLLGRSTMLQASSTAHMYAIQLAISTTSNMDIMRIYLHGTYHESMFLCDWRMSQYMLECDRSSTRTPKEPITPARREVAPLSPPNFPLMLVFWTAPGTNSHKL